MKKLIKTTMIAGVFAIFAFTPANEPKTELPPVENEVEEVCVDEDALRCVVRNDDGEKIAACWFCNCAEVTKAALSKSK